MDTSALIALVDRSDTYHSLFLRLFSAPPALGTTALVVAEGHAWCLKRYDRYRAMQFAAMVEDMAPMELWPVGPDEIAGAMRFVRRFGDQDLTLADAAGLHMMAVRKIRRCWSTDRHLGLAGAELVIDH